MGKKYIYKISTEIFGFGNGWLLTLFQLVLQRVIATQEVEAMLRMTRMKISVSPGKLLKMFADFVWPVKLKLLLDVEYLHHNC